MKKIFKAAALSLAAFTLLTAAACGGLRKADKLGAPAEVTPLGYYDAAETDPVLRDAAKAFASAFTAETFKGRTDAENIALSPVSVYLALGLAAECASGGTREEILSVLGTDYDTLKANYAGLYRSLIAEYESNTGANSGRLDVGNSIWLQKGSSFKSSCIENLSDRYLCWSYAADFRSDGRGANDAVRDFVKQQTHGLIDCDPELSEETVFALINTLYFKDLWNQDGNDLPYAAGDHSFVQGNGEEKSVRLMQGYYLPGRAYEAETFTHFFTETVHGYKLKFILPKEGHALGEILTAENLTLVNEMGDYRTFDEEEKIEYHTRCLFPAYRAGFDEDVKPVLRTLGIEELFSAECDLTALTADESVYCDAVRHMTVLNVDRKGIEGAAVTTLPAAGAPGPGEYTIVEQDFILSRAFGFLITDRLDNVLFSGIVNCV